jgi:hypothetical protein
MLTIQNLLLTVVELKVIRPAPPDNDSIEESRGYMDIPPLALLAAREPGVGDHKTDPRKKLTPMPQVLATAQRGRLQLLAW